MRVLVLVFESAFPEKDRNIKQNRIINIKVVVICFGWFLLSDASVVFEATVLSLVFFMICLLNKVDLKIGLDHSIFIWERVNKICD